MPFHPFSLEIVLDLPLQLWSSWGTLQTFLEFPYEVIHASLRPDAKMVYFFYPVSFFLSFLEQLFL